MSTLLGIYASEGAADKAIAELPKARVQDADGQAVERGRLYDASVSQRTTSKGTVLYAVHIRRRVERLSRADRVRLPRVVRFGPNWTDVHAMRFRPRPPHNPSKRVKPARTKRRDWQHDDGWRSLYISPQERALRSAQYRKAQRRAAESNNG